MAPLFASKLFCEACFKPYSKKGEHRCADVCKNCYRTPACVTIEQRTCATCNRTFKNGDCFKEHQRVQNNGNSICNTRFMCRDCGKLINLTERKNKQHICGELYCMVCKLHVPEGHLCHIKPKKPKASGVRRSNCVYIFYDLETVQIKKHAKGLEHEPYLLVAQVTCLSCIDKEEAQCIDCGKRLQVFIGSLCVVAFMTYISNSFSSFASVICIAHNAKAYDGQWIMRYMLEKKWEPKVTETGSKLMKITYENLTFLDSVNYIPMPLSKFTASFDLPPLSVKGFFPHFLFNVVNHPFDVNHPETTNYTSDRLPPEESYDFDGMTSGDRQKFLEWYTRNKEQPFNFLSEAILYCKMDVTVLRQGCTVYRRLYLEKTSIDPFTEASTIAGTCMAIFKTLFLKENQIGIVPAGGYRLKDKQSAVALQWLGWIEHKTGFTLDSCLRGKEKRIGSYKVDGFESVSNTVYEFHGCYWHGHTCLRDRQTAYYNDPSITAETLFEQTMLKTSKLKEAGYQVVEKWECDWASETAGSPEIQDFIAKFKLPEKLEVLNPRDAFFGGRTEAIQLYRKCSPGERIMYQDFTSLYPWVNKNGRYPIGHPTIYLYKDCLPLDQAEGLMKCKVLPPRGLYLPLLPVRFNGKLFFPLCRSCVNLQQDKCLHSDEERAITGTWVTCELRKATELGYVILETLEQWHYSKTTQYNKVTGEGGIFADYVNLWLKEKQEASGWPKPDLTEEEKQAYITDYKDNEGVALTYDNIKVNPGLRQIAKLNLNSLWGKFGQRPDLTKTDIIAEADKWFGLLYDPSVDVKSVLPINDNVLIAKWNYSEKVDLVQSSQSVVIAAYTTALARLKLYSLLETLQDRVLYFDTDSVIYTCAPDEEPLPTGNYLGQLTDELGGSYIDEFASGGSKNYGYLVKDNKSSFKCKGIRLNHRNGSLVNFETLKRQLGVECHPEEPVVVKEPHGIVRLPDHTVLSRPQTKTYRVVYDKRRRVKNFKTLPWGY